MKTIKFFVTTITIFSIKFCICQDEGYTVPNIFRFPYGPLVPPYMGIFVALSFPLEVNQYDLFFSYVFEANYNIPSNETGYIYPPIISKRSWDRKFIYEWMESKLKSHGFGKQCLLRSICEASQYSLKSTGVLGDILHVVLTPSSSIQENLNDYEKAEAVGRTKKSCAKYKCPFSILDLVSWIGPLI